MIMANVLEVLLVAAGTTGFGTTGSLFGAKPFASTAFSFNPSGSTTTGSLFKPFSVTTTASTPLFGMMCRIC